MAAYYNEIDPFAAQWLRNLIEAGHIAGGGHVDERDIRDIKPAELLGYTQCHFFAGLGGWSRALRLAGWGDDQAVWTGSCPCQPFSCAGKGAGLADERHLWPHFHWLVSQCRPAIVFGEQVASKDGLAWLDLVSADLEGEGYAVGSADLCAAGVGAPHIRQRLYWCAKDGLDNGNHPRLEGHGMRHQAALGRDGTAGPVAEAGQSGELADTLLQGGGGRGIQGPGEGDGAGSGSACERPEGLCRDGGLADLQGPRRGVWDSDDDGQADGEVHAPCDDHQAGLVSVRPRATNGDWASADWLFCRDQKWRSVEPGTFPLANGVPGRVGRLRAYGNAIVPQVAQAFIEACMG